MTKDVLFVVHGMGVFEDGWEKPIRAKLEQVAGRYTRFAEDPTKLWDQLELVPVGYDDSFRKTLKDWKESGKVLDFVKGQQLVGAPDLSWLEPLAEQDPEFFWTHVADVVIYRYFRLHRAALRVHVARQIVEHVTESTGGAFDRCTVLAHSLGTAVVHDSLHVLETKPLGGKPTAFHPLNARFRSLFMLANVSHILEDDIRAYRSLVRGGPPDSTTSLCTTFRSFHHELDPFCFLRRFQPKEDGEEGWDPPDNAVIGIGHYRDWDIHAFEHYLDHPRVHGPLLNQACGENVITPAEATRARNTYDKYGEKFVAVPKFKAALERAKQQLSRLEASPDLATVVDVYRELRAIFGELRELIGEFRKQFDQDEGGG